MMELTFFFQFVQHPRVITGTELEISRSKLNSRRITTPLCRPDVTGYGPPYFIRSAFPNTLVVPQNTSIRPCKNLDPLSIRGPFPR